MTETRSGNAALSDASEYALRVGERLTKNSLILDPKFEDSTAKFERNEIILGELLGSGGFNHVYELHRIKLMKEPITSSWSPSEQEQNKRCLLAKKCTKEKYAVKFLSYETMNNPDKYINGAADLFVEAKYLSSLTVWEHINIIQLHGLAADGASGFSQNVEGGYFLIIDRLYDTLDKRMQIWKAIESRTRKFEGAYYDDDDATHHKLLRASFLTRLTAAFDLSSALRHLHNLNIIFRDLKPQNIGFDCNGILKLFDFGLAKELMESQRFADGTYKMSGDTGSRLFMAPEVVMCQPYNLSADIYSFSLLLWQVCSLKDPFDNMAIDEHLEYAILSNKRPEIDVSWSPNLQTLMTDGWARDPIARPSINDVHRCLKRETRTFNLNESSSPKLPSRTVSSQDLKHTKKTSIPSRSRSSVNICEMGQTKETSNYNIPRMKTHREGSVDSNNNSYQKLP